MNDQETALIQTNLNNALSTDTTVEFHSSLTRILSRDTNIRTIIITPDFNMSLEYLTLAYEEYYDELEDDDIDLEDRDENERLKIQFYRQINAMGENADLLVGEPDLITANIAHQISRCPQLEHLIIDGSNDWLDNDELVYFFEELRPTTMTNLTLRNCSFHNTEAANLTSILASPTISTFTAEGCIFPINGVDTLMDEEWAFENYTHINMVDCHFYRSNDPDQDHQDVYLANCLSTSVNLQELVFQNCGLSAKAIRILRRIETNQASIINIEN